MKIRERITLSLLMLSLTLPAAWADVQLRVFAGGANQRPDAARRLLDEFERANPGIKVQVETGGATSELQRQYLGTMLGARDPGLDAFLLDVVAPAQFAAAGWLEPLDAYLGRDRDRVLGAYLPAYARADLIGNRLVALPYTADALFLYYRKDLLDKHHLPVPKTWAELGETARKLQAAEKTPALQGLSLQGAPIEGAVCSFLLPYWSQGREIADAQGRLTLDQPAAVRGLKTWLALVDQGVVRRNVAEVKTGDTVDDFKAGQVLFALNWGFAWDRFQDDADSKVKGKVGVAVLPAVAGGKPVSCIGGWQWGVSAFSRHKPEAVKLIRFLSQPAVARRLAIDASLLPVFPELYRDREVLHRAPWFAAAEPVVASARSRPVHARYGEVSDVIRTATSAALARTVTPEQAVAGIAARLKRVFR
jgi:multiple sugar transport system substrate-binding protein